MLSRCRNHTIEIDLRPWRATVHLSMDALIFTRAWRRQRVKINKIAANWATLNGGIPQGTWLGPNIFLIHINDLQTTLPAFKFIDDVTVIEVIKVIDNIASSQLQTSVDEIVTWSTDNHMNINTSKTKEMIIDFARSSQSIVTEFTTADDCPIERVSSFKLFGITLSNDLRWSCHVREISAKANKRLHFLKLLKRSAMTTDDLLHYYKTVIRPVIEYACPVLAVIFNCWRISKTWSYTKTSSYDNLGC